MAIRTIRQRNIPPLFAALQPELRWQVAEDGAALGAMHSLGWGDALSVKELLQGRDKLTGALGAWSTHVASPQTAERTVI